MYVFLRLKSIPAVIPPKLNQWVKLAFVVLWACFPLGRVLDRKSDLLIAFPIEWVGAAWMGVLFLALAFFFMADVVTGFGFWLRQWVLKIRLAALGLTAVLSLAAFVQGGRLPKVVEYQAALSGLPAELKGKTLVHLSDLHLGAMVGIKRLKAILSQVEALQPDIVTLTGDIVDGSVVHSDEFASVLKELKAPLGVWAVTGNHEVYSGLEKNLAFLQACGFHVLRDRWALAAPGLVMAGVDDVEVHQKNYAAVVSGVLESVPLGAVIFLAHSPVQVRAIAAMNKANLMLSGHTHNGQIWPFNYIVKIFYPYIYGKYEVDGMTLIVSPGAGRWGPPMRLFGRSEIIRVVLRNYSGGHG